MSKRLFDVVEVDIPCPNCGHEAKHSVGQLRIDKNVYCSYCGKRSPLEMEEAIKALEVLDQVWNDLLDRLHSNTGKSSTTLEGRQTLT